MLVKPNVSCKISLIVMTCLLVAVYQQSRNFKGVLSSCVVIVEFRKVKVGVCFVLDIRLDF